MLTNLYLYIIFLQVITCKNTYNEPAKSVNHKTALQLLNIVNPSYLNRRSLLKNEAKFFESVVETATTKTSKRSIITEKYQNSKNEKNYHDVKILLTKLLEQLVEIEKDKRDDKLIRATEKEKAHGSSEKAHISGGANKIKKKKKDENKHTRWGHWTDWSSCSVSCGKGRQIRWRHCIENCEEAETEMEEKSCQLPACGPGKLFGVIQL